MNVRATYCDVIAVTFLPLSVVRRTSNLTLPIWFVPIESTFATIRHCTERTKGCMTRDSLLHMVFKLGQCIEKNWRKLRDFAYLAKVVEGVTFIDGEEIEQPDRVAT